MHGTEEKEERVEGKQCKKEKKRRKEKEKAIPWNIRAKGDIRKEYVLKKRKLKEKEKGKGSVWNRRREEVERDNVRNREKEGRN